MIQTSLFSELEKDIEPLGNWFAKKYPSRYKHPDTGAVLKGSLYIKNGKKTAGVYELFINNEWVKACNVPEKRELRKKRDSSLEGFFIYFKQSMVSRSKRHGKFLIGDNEFEDKYGCYDKILAHFNQQVERYGYRCPITNLEFTTVRPNNKNYKGRRREKKMLLTNISSDRILNHINYTKQNVLFTSAGWNLARGELSLSEMKTFLNKECVERYEEILMERFPDYKEENNI
tara:strand:- start:122 stop:814 length:693 start_codon:yes stop_codon:yes gene_type:complete